MWDSLAWHFFFLRGIIFPYFLVVWFFFFFFFNTSSGKLFFIFYFFLFFVINADYLVGVDYLVEIYSFNLISYFQE